MKRSRSSEEESKSQHVSKESSPYFGRVTNEELLWFNSAAKGGTEINVFHERGVVGKRFHRRRLHPQHPVEPRPKDDSNRSCSVINQIYARHRRSELSVVCLCTHQLPGELPVLTGRPSLRLLPHHPQQNSGQAGW